MLDHDVMRRGVSEQRVNAHAFVAPLFFAHARGASDAIGS